MEVLNTFTGEETLNKEFIPKLNKDLGVLDTNTKEVASGLSQTNGKVATLEQSMPQFKTELTTFVNNKTKPMQGATSALDGKQGLVPVPKAGDNNSCLFGDGTYRKVAGLPIGFEYFSFSKYAPIGSLPYLGGLFSRETYKELFEKMQADGRVVSEEVWQSTYKQNNGNVPFYSEGVSIGTFRVPNITCYVKGANNYNSIGMYTKEGLPNITGEITSTNASYGGVQGFTPKYGGAFTPSVDKGVSASGKATTPGIELHFDASNSNPIYGASAHVTPETVSGCFYVVALGAVTNVGEADVSNFVQDVTNLEVRVNDLDKNQVKPKRYIIETYQSGNNWYEKYNDGWIRQGGLVVVPSSGSNAFQVNLLLPFLDANYLVLVTSGWSSSTGNGWDYAHSKTSTGFKGVFAGGDAGWIAEGQGA